MKGAQEKNTQHHGLRSPGKTNFFGDSWWRHHMETFSVLLALCAGSPVNSPHKEQWRGALMFSLNCAWIDGWVNNREAGNLRRHHAYYDVAVISIMKVKRFHLILFLFFSAGKKLFREFLRSEYSEENMLFYLACEDLKKESNPELVEEKARLIYEDYISILSPKEVKQYIFKYFKVQISSWWKWNMRYSLDNLFKQELKHRCKCSQHTESCSGCPVNVEFQITLN